MTGARTVQGWGRLGGFGESEVRFGSGELGRVRSRTVEIGSRAKAATWAGAERSGKEGCSRSCELRDALCSHCASVCAKFTTGAAAPILDHLCYRATAGLPLSEGDEEEEASKQRRPGTWTGSTTMACVSNRPTGHPPPGMPDYDDLCEDRLLSPPPPPIFTMCKHFGSQGLARIFHIERKFESSFTQCVKIFKQFLFNDP